MGSYISNISIDPIEYDKLSIIDNPGDIDSLIEDYISNPNSIPVPEDTEMIKYCFGNTSSKERSKTQTNVISNIHCKPSNSNIYQAGKLTWH